MRKQNKIKLPKVGELLAKQSPTKNFIIQKTTSIAGVAFVIGLRSEELGPNEVQRLNEETKAARWSNISRGARTCRGEEEHGG